MRQLAPPPVEYPFPTTHFDPLARDCPENSWQPTTSISVTKWLPYRAVSLTQSCSSTEALLQDAPISPSTTLGPRQTSQSTQSYSFASFPRKREDSAARWKLAAASSLSTCALTRMSRPIIVRTPAAHNDLLKNQVLTCTWSYTRV